MRRAASLTRVGAVSTAGENVDVIVVGAGPGGSTAAAYLASAGLDVVLLEKAAFPRDKICGDGLTPRAVRQLIDLGVPTRLEDGWIRNRGLRIIGGGHRLELDWPDDVPSFPSYGLTRARMNFDEMLARHAVGRGARLLERHNVTGPVLGADGRTVVGVEAKLMDESGRATRERVVFRAPVVIAADGNSSRLAISVGRERRDDRPMGVAVRTYFRTPRHDDDYMESWVELKVKENRDNPRSRDILLPGYGWIFPLGDGTANVGLGMLDSSPAFGKVDYKDVMQRWVASMPAEWEFTPETMTTPVRGAALPMAFNRSPLYEDGLLLIGDAGGMVSPFNGEGIDYAMESGRMAAEIVAQAIARPTAEQRNRVLSTYPDRMKAHLGGQFMLGTYFAALIGHPEVMRFGIKYGLPRTSLMKILLKVMANIREPHGGVRTDRVIEALTRLTPSA
ncbi:geranylgeranyl reductase family [Dermatophilus congolensis]|uniref:Geranylgeranyl reductase family n=1 Tax=Dermatophilus congolensis TaxID=1863 RepID=A0A239VT08_9MICO|nr:geranylgeranyl reductase family [Dermatophilus congolensis]